ncbi:MAG: methyltransferase domain-containing protein [Proteobacteria bacterium]|nr:methyltransferase domain-containing protein [Pseudomonadota bacterium]
MSESVTDFRIRSVMCVPLFGVNQRPLGAIQLDTQSYNHRFSEDDLQILCSVANQAGIAMENARLHAETIAQERIKRELTFARQVQQGFLPKTMPRVPGYEFWAFYVKKKITLGMRLTKISFRKRSYRDEDRPGSLRPTIAGALVALSDPTPGEIVLDPMCGAGTILLERGAWGDGARLIGCDIDSKAIDVARASAEKARLEVEFLDQDSTEEGVYEELTGQVSRIITNLPFGKQFTSENLQSLYTEALRAWKPLLKPGGKMVLLTSEEKVLRAAGKGEGLFVKPIEKVRIKGLEAGVFLLG